MVYDLTAQFTQTVLMVMGNNDVKVIRSAANIPTLQTIPVEQLNTYDVVKNAVVVMAQGAVEFIENYCKENNIEGTLKCCIPQNISNDFYTEYGFIGESCDDKKEIKIKQNA